MNEQTKMTQEDMIYNSFVNSGKNFIMLLTLFETQAEILAHLKQTKKEDELSKIKERWAEIIEEEIEATKKSFGK